MFWLDPPPAEPVRPRQVSRRLVKKWSNKARRLNRLVHRAWEDQKRTSKRYPGDISPRAGKLMDHDWSTVLACLERGGISSDEYDLLHYREGT